MTENFEKYYENNDGIILNDYNYSFKLFTIIIAGTIAGYFISFKINSNTFYTILASFFFSTLLATYLFPPEKI